MLVRIAIDTEGGDKGLEATIPASLDALAKFSDIYLILVGQNEQLITTLNKHNPKNLFSDRYHIYPSGEKIAMDEPLSSAMRKHSASMRLAIKLVKQDKADACVSAGNSGALMAISRAVLKTISGINRPAIATYLPTRTGSDTYILDLGANIDSSADDLLSFAVMGSVIVQNTKNIKNPSIALLNIGSEDIKGKAVIKKTAELLTTSDLNYHGFIEADTIYTDPVDVVVCDGFEGNLVLKASEGAANMIHFYLKKAFYRTFWTKFIAFLAMPALKDFKKRLDPKRYNGASLLGLKGIVIKSHGSACALSFLYAITEARLEASKQINVKIQQEIGLKLATIKQ